jgi:hypothetical protein
MLHSMFAFLSSYAAACVLHAYEHLRNLMMITGLTVTEHSIMLSSLLDVLNVNGTYMVCSKYITLQLL